MAAWCLFYLVSSKYTPCLPPQVDISTEVGVVHDIRLQELRLYTDYGRCCRPLFIVEQQAIKVGGRMSFVQCSRLGWAAIRR